MYSFLRNYRATQHSTTKQTPSELFFGRKINTKLPNSPVKQKQNKLHKRAKMSDKHQKIKMKSYADKRNNAQPSKLQVGDKVLVKQRIKISSRYLKRSNQGTFMLTYNEIHVAIMEKKIF